MVVDLPSASETSCRGSMLAARMNRASDPACAYHARVSAKMRMERHLRRTQMPSTFSANAYDRFSENDNARARKTRRKRRQRHQGCP
eukprot:3478887-Rhodomonas_salina.1